MSQNTWQEHFRSRMQQIKAAFDHSDGSLSLLAFALKHNHLSQQEYFAWASSTYQLPILSMEFFKVHPPTAEFYAKWKNEAPWTAEYLPIAEWDGALIIAGTEPPAQWPQNTTCVFVLAPWVYLAATWASYHPQAKVTTARPAVIPSSKPNLETPPEGMDFSGIPSSGRTNDDLGSFDNLNFNGSPSASDDNPNMSDFSHSMGMDSANASESDNSNMMEGLDESILTTIRHNDVPSEGDIFDASSLEKTLVRQDTIDSSIQTDQFEDGRTEIRATADGEPDSDIAAMYDPNQEYNNHINDGLTGTFAMKRINADYGELIRAKVDSTFAQMKSHFEKSMILIVDERESRVSIFAWDESFEEKKGKASSIPLRTPSIFNIVATTGKPFHGYVSLNEVNEKFFEDWNHGTVPDHITIAPIIANEKVIGMLMGFAEKSAYNKAALNLAEKLSSQLLGDIEVAA